MIIGPGRNSTTRRRNIKRGKERKKEKKEGTIKQRKKERKKERKKKEKVTTCKNVVWYRTTNDERLKKKKWVGTNLLVVTASLVNRWLIKAAIIHVEP